LRPFLTATPSVPRPYDAAMPRRAVSIAAGALLLLSAILTAVGWSDDPAKLPDWQALILGLVQGLTELLPVSSSGHLILVPWLGDWTYLKENEAFNQTFDVALHLGTLVAVVGYFWRDIVGLVRAWLGSVSRRSVRTTEERLSWVIFAATIPAAVIGGLGESLIQEHLGEPWQIAILLAVFAGVLLLADRRPAVRSLDTLSTKEGVLLGFAQSLALAPGVSRSGITITAGRLLGLDRDAAARMSFLLLVPIVLGAVLLKGVKDVVIEGLPSGSTGPFVVGTLAAAGSGLLAIDWLLGYIRRRTYDVFVGYRLLIAIAILVLIVAGVRSSGF
jgi:undecaprenyl-diphosphatase